MGLVEELLRELQAQELHDSFELRPKGTSPLQTVCLFAPTACMHLLSHSAPPRAPGPTRYGF